MRAVRQYETVSTIYATAKTKEPAIKIKSSNTVADVYCHVCLLFCTTDSFLSKESIYNLTRSLNCDFNLHLFLPVYFLNRMPVILSHIKFMHTHTMKFQTFDIIRSWFQQHQYRHILDELPSQFD